MGQRSRLESERVIKRVGGRERRRGAESTGRGHGLEY